MSLPIPSFVLSWAGFVSGGRHADVRGVSFKDHSLVTIEAGRNTLFIKNLTLLGRYIHYA